MAVIDGNTIRNHAAFIWSVADLLRGDYKQSEYGKVILPLTVNARCQASTPRRLARPSLDLLLGVALGSNPLRHCAALARLHDRNYYFRPEHNRLMVRLNRTAANRRRWHRGRSYRMR